VLLVDLDASLAQSIADRWSQFIFSEDVRVENVTAHTRQIGVYGPRAAKVLGLAFAASEAGHEAGVDRETLRSLAVYSNVRLSHHGDHATVLASDDIGAAGFDVVLPASLSEPFTAALRRAGASDASPAAADICRIEGGRPLFLTDMDTNTIPLEAGIEDRAISLTKGCYVGQEIIIRVLHRGHGRVARKLVGITFERGATVPAPRAAVSAVSKDIGEITSAVDSPALGRPVALGYVHRDFLEPGTVVEVAGVPAAVASLPFVPVTPLV
jgi:folate-binding protein YgfZ